MNLPGGFDLNSMMEQAKQMQEQMGREMKEMTVDASAGGGAVAVKMRGDFEVVELTIADDLVKDGDTEMIQDLTVAAINEARRKVEESLKGKAWWNVASGVGALISSKFKVRSSMFDSFYRCRRSWLFAQLRRISTLNFELRTLNSDASHRSYARILRTGRKTD